MGGGRRWGRAAAATEASARSISAVRAMHSDRTCPSNQSASNDGSSRAMTRVSIAGQRRTAQQQPPTGADCWRCCHPPAPLLAVAGVECRRVVIAVVFEWSGTASHRHRAVALRFAALRLRPLGLAVFSSARSAALRRDVRFSSPIRHPQPPQRSAVHAAKAAATSRATLAAS
jgi:hypothetical protein